MLTLQPIWRSRPVNEAVVLITICDDDVRQARIEALHNCRHAETDDEVAFWFRVLQVLTPSAMAQA
jgi:hypothetical protein